MNCCEKCFQNQDMQGVIRNKKLQGDCDICGAQSVFIQPLDSECVLRDSFDFLLDVYTPENNLPEKYPKDFLDHIENHFCNDWSIFNLEAEKISRLLHALYPNPNDLRAPIIHDKVGILEKSDTSYLQQYSIVGSSTWDAFVKAIKFQNRFFSYGINDSVMQPFLNLVKKTHKKGSIFYRARIAPNEEGFPLDKMGAPPKGKATSGRANSEGISCLYLSDSEETTLHEARVGEYDYVSIAQFEAVEDVEVVNIALLSEISPFLGSDITQLAVNLSNFKRLGKEVAKPMRRHDSSLDYLPTQYLCDYIKSLGYAGFEYKSSMNEGGSNVAIFYPNKFKCVAVSVFDVQSLVYTYNKIN